MPNFNSYSPWQDASDNVFQPAGQALNQLALEIAKSRYNKRNEAARIGLELEKLQQQHLLDTAHEGLYGSQAKNFDARTSHQQAVDEAARELQKSVVANDYPHPLQNGPTIADQAQMLSARQHGSAALVAGLHGSPQEAFQVHNIPANNVAMDPMSGMTVGRGAIELAPGGMYQAPGQEPVVNQRPYFAPAGSTPFTQAGEQSGPQTGFRPQTAGSKSAATDNTLIKALVSGDIQEPGSYTNSTTKAVTTIPASPMYIAATNALARANQAGAAPVTTQPAAPTARPQHSPQEEALLKDANDAIAKGADPEKVKARLKQMGYNPN